MGTSSTRVLLVKKDGCVLAQSKRVYSTRYEGNGVAEQDPDEIYTKMIDAIKEIVLKANDLGENPAAIVFSSQMYSLMLLDKNKVPLTRLIIWADNRAAKTVLRYRKENDIITQYKNTGCPVRAVYPFSKILWFKENEKSLFNRCYMFSTIKDYIFYKMTGNHLLDWSSASATGLFNINKLEWDKECLEKLGISEEFLPKLCSPYSMHEIKRDFLETCGFKNNVFLILGGGDGPLANIGAGSIEEKNVNCDIGTSGAIRLAVKRPILPEDESIWCYVVDEEFYVAGGIIVNAGNALEWCIKEIYQSKDANFSYSEIESELTVFNNTFPLIFLPFFAGEKNPGWNEEARAAILGLSFGNKKIDILRALIEGITFSIYDIYKVLERVYGEVSEIRVTGGYTNMGEWVKIQSNIFGKELIIPKVMEGSAMGAAFIGMKALGWIKSLVEVKNYAGICKRIHPDVQMHKYYSQVYKLYKFAYNVMKEFATRYL